MDLRIVAREGDLVCVSDKPVDKVIGYAVRFEDGSWANLRSRRYTGSAPGRVFFLRAPANGARPGAPSRTHELGRVVALTLHAGGGDVVVHPAGEQGTIEVQGSAGFVDAVELDRRAGHVQATWDGGATTDGGVVRCLVPGRCKLAVQAAGDAHVWIAGPSLELRASLDDEASLVCERALDMDLELNGSGGAFVGIARGRARVRANASGSVVVAGGRLAELDAMVQAAGSVVVHAAVDDALLSNSGTGAMSVPAIAHLSERHGRGAGPLLAGRPPAPADEAW